MGDAKGVGGPGGHTDDLAKLGEEKLGLSQEFALEAATNYLTEINVGGATHINFWTEFVDEAKYEAAKAYGQQNQYNRAIAKGQDVKLSDFQPSDRMIKYYGNQLDFSLQTARELKAQTGINYQSKYHWVTHLAREQEQVISNVLPEDIQIAGFGNRFGQGCDFGGVLQIKEFYSDEMDIPDSYFCGWKCAKRYVELMDIKIDSEKIKKKLNKKNEEKLEVLRKLEVEDEKERVKVNKKIKTLEKKLTYHKFFNPDQKPMGDSDIMTAKAYRLLIKNAGIWDKFPILARWDEEKKGFVRMDNTHVTSSEYAIIHVEMDKNEYHAILYKNKENVAKLKKERFLALDQSYFKKYIILEKSVTLTNDQKILKQPSGKNFISTYYVFDIETCAKFYIKKRKNKKGEIIENAKQTLVPISLSVTRVDVSEKLEFIDEKNVQNFTGEDCCDQFIRWLGKEQNLPLAKYVGVKKPQPTIYLFSHNGGNFDTLYCKASKELKHRQEIKGNTIKRLESKIISSENFIVFLDSYLFTQAKLSEAAKFFNTQRKMLFDIVGMKRADYDLDEKEQPNDTEEIKIKRKWRQYLTRDVVCLGEIINKLELYLRKFGCSMANHCGIPGVAWEIMNNNCIWLREATVASNAVTCKFIRESAYGGRLEHWKKLIGDTITALKSRLKGDPVEEKCENPEEYICLDANSLYPSAMFIGQFPVGPFEINNNPDLAFMNKLNADGKMFIAEVSFDPGNLRFPLIPYRTEKSHQLIYPANEFFMLAGERVQFRGVYNSVEINEAIRLGYKVTGVYRLLFWNKKERIFEHLVKSLFDERANLKLEGNPMEYLCKITLNSLYGKLLEIIKTIHMFMNKGAKVKRTQVYNKLTEFFVLPNEQTELSYARKRPKENKPVHIGSFVLSYARVIMNDLIRKVGPENVAYSDTDSIYVKKSALTAEIAAEIEKSKNDLCGFKNDYGEKSTIVRAIFIDIKRYLIELRYAPEHVKERQKIRDETKKWFDEEKIKIDKILSETKDPVEINKQKRNYLNALRKYEIAEEKNYFPRFKAKFVGVNFKDKTVTKNWTNQGKLSELENMYSWFLLNPGKCSDIPIIQEKWERYSGNKSEQREGLDKEYGVKIETKDMMFCANPDSRGKWINVEKELVKSVESKSGFIYEEKKDIDRLDYFPIGYDFTQPERKYPILEPFSPLEALKKMHSKQYQYTGGRLRSRSILTYPKNDKKEQKKINFIETAKLENKTVFKPNFVKIDKTIYMMEEERGKQVLFNICKYGRKDRVDLEKSGISLEKMDLLISLREDLFPSGIKLTEQENDNLCEEINSIIVRTLKAKNKKA